MKNFYIFILLLLIPIYLNKTLPIWKLSIKDENAKSNIINLFQGIFTKITLVLTNEKGKEEFDNNSDYPISFTISLNNKNLVSISNSYTLIPSESLVYSIYVGIKCGETLSDTKSLFTLNKYVNANLEIDSSFSLKLSSEKAKIDMELLMNEIAEQSYNLFRIKKEPYNIEEIKLVPKYEDENSDFTFEKIVLDSYDGKRGEYSPSNTQTNGILNKFKFGTKKLFKNLSKTSVKFDLTFEAKNLEKCFDLVKKSFNLKVVQKKVQTIGENVKKAIIYTLENISPINELTNSLELKLNIPVAPIAVTCELRADQSFSKTNEDIVNHADASATYYDNVFTSTGEFTFKLGNLNSTLEYYSKCVFSNTGFLDELKQNISIKIGNFLESEVFSKLVPSRDPERLSQCAKFTFDNIFQTLIFKTLLPKYCRFAMRRGLPILSRLSSDVVCRVVDYYFNYGISSESYINICVAPSPILSVNRLISQMTPKQYNDNFEKFINDVKDANKLSTVLGLSIVVKKVERYYDKTPDTSKISMSVTKSTSILTGTNLNVKITSQNEDPIECYYNSDLTKDNTKKFSLLGLLTIESIVLNPNKEESFTLNIKKSDLESGKMYPLYMQCYSLPKFLYRFETTGIFNPYTFLNDDSISEQDPQTPVKVKINCNKLINKMNPHCIKNNLNNLIEKIKTDIPTLIKNLQGEVETFKKLANNAQIKILKNLNTTLKTVINEVKNNKKKLKSFVEEGITIAKYLSSRDCSIYASGETNEGNKTYKAGLYVECRNSKKYILSQLLDTVKDQLQCSKIVEVITSNLSDDIEQNLKYILFLINELTNNPEALEQGKSQIVYDLANCLQEKFNEYWPKIEQYLKEKQNYLQQSILAVKKDISNILMQSLSNLVNLLHFEEIDGYIQQAKEEVEKNGLIIIDKAKNINKNIFEFLKKFNEFGDNFYNISASMGVNVTVNSGKLDNSTDAQVFISDIKDKGIKLILHSNYMLREKGAYAMQTVFFDSPLVSVNAQNEIENGTLNTFIGITLYDKDGNEIVVSDMKLEDFRPQILFNSKLYDAMKTCVYYNEKEEKLYDDGVETIEDFIYEGEKFIKCVPKHLTSFTLGTPQNSQNSQNSGDSQNSQNPENSSNVGLIILIVVLCLLLIAGLIVGFIIYRKKCSNKVNKNDIESSFPDKTGINA